MKNCLKICYYCRRLYSAESGVDYVKTVHKIISKFEFCAACQGHFVGMSVFSYRVKYIVFGKSLCT
jgi:hypothetical protein